MNGFKICYVSSEVLPFTPYSGLANTSKALPAALKEMDQDVRLMMPKYKLINERKYVLREVIRLREVKIDLNSETKLANGKTAFLPNSKVHVYFLSVPEYFNKKGVYADPQSNNEYPDNAERFAYFCRGVLETLKLLYWQPDIIHCNDWSTALIPFYLKTHYREDEFFRNTRTVLTVHDFASQGIFPLERYQQLGIPEEHFSEGGELELHGQLNFLKGGLLSADAISTVGENYLQKLMAGEVPAHGLEEVLAQRKRDLSGIINGADYHAWDPETDKHIPAQFDAKSLPQKAEARTALCEHFQVSDDPTVALVAVLSDLSDEKGGDLLVEAMEDLLKLSIRLVILAENESKNSKKIARIAGKFPGKLIFQERYDIRLAHLLIAGADMILLPARVVSHDTTHLHAMRYGTVPVVRENFDYFDSIKPVDPETGKGNGFTFTDYHTTAMLKALKTAIKAFKDQKLWQKIQKTAMRADFSWDMAATKYLKLYEKTLKKR